MPASISRRESRENVGVWGRDRPHRTAESGPLQTVPRRWQDYRSSYSLAAAECRDDEAPTEARWGQIAQMRAFMVHQYLAVDLDIFQVTVTKDFSKLATSAACQLADVTVEHAMKRVAAPQPRESKERAVPSIQMVLEFE